MLRMKLIAVMAASLLMNVGAFAQSSGTGAAPATGGSGAATTGGAAGGNDVAGSATKEIPNMQKNGMGNAQAPGVPTTATQQNGATNN